MFEQEELPMKRVPSMDEATELYNDRIIAKSQYTMIQSFHDQNRANYYSLSHGQRKTMDDINAQIDERLSSGKKISKSYGDIIKNLKRQIKDKEQEIQTLQIRTEKLEGIILQQEEILDEISRALEERSE